MITRESIAENLISCRNILLGGRINENVLPCLKEVIEGIGLITNSCTKNIIEYCVVEAIKFTEEKDYIAAGLTLNLIHNFPLNEVSQQHWDIDYFLSMELPTFLEHFEEIKSARQISLYVCQQLAHQYLSDNL